MKPICAVDSKTDGRKREGRLLEIKVDEITLDGADYWTNASTHGLS